MNSGTFRFKVGRFECVSVSDGSFNYPPQSLFVNVARQQLDDVLRQHALPTEHVATPYTCLLIVTGQHRVLVDTGAGNLSVHAPAVFPGIDHSTTVTGKLVENMRQLGIKPSDIDTVIITHAHPDHVGGTLTAAGALTFPNARYFVPRNEWDFWHSATAETSTPPTMVSIARRNLAPLEPQLTLVDDGFEIVPGIQAIATPGHTPGHIALSITSEQDQLLHISDVVLYPLHLEYPDWLPVFDISPPDAAASKQKIFNRAAADQTLVFAHHFPPFPNLGHVRATETGWQWEPLQV